MQDYTAEGRDGDSEALTATTSTSGEKAIPTAMSAGPTRMTPTTVRNPRERSPRCRPVSPTATGRTNPA